MNKLQFSAVREKLDLTQPQLADKIGISISAVKSYESGRRNIPKIVENILKYFLQEKRNSPLAEE